MKKNKQKGFTLIELMVVISIIALLSSIVLAALQNAKDKANARAYKQGILELVKGIELYRADNGYYPFEAELANPAYGGYIYYGITFRSRPGATPLPEATNMDPIFLNFPTLLKKYISKIPDPYIPGYFIFQRKLSGSRCWGDTNNSPYVILIGSNTPGFENWPYAEIDDTQDTFWRCFSIK